MPRMKKCRHCKASFQPSKPLQVACSPLCAIEIAKVKRIKDERKDARERREKIKTVSDLKKEAETAVHAYVRSRDEGKPCISCGTPLTAEGVGGGFDAGHYRSRGAADHLRYDADRNIFGQCKQCNRYLSGNAVAMRKGMIDRVGIGVVDAVENDNTAHKWTRDELIGIKAEYVKKRKALIAQK